MLTAAQCEVVAYATDNGLVCLECGREADLGGRTIAEAEVIEYSASEWQSESAQGYGRVDGLECECEPALECADCGAEILEAHTYGPIAPFVRLTDEQASNGFGGYYQPEAERYIEAEPCETAEHEYA